MKLKHKIKLMPGIRLIIGFASIIIIGGILLWLPISHQTGKSISAVNSFFISASAVCVTGLSTIDVGNTLSVFGSVVLATLIQLGGLGFATIAVFFLMILGNNLSYSNLTLARESLNTIPGFDIRSLVKTVIITSLVCEIVGSALFYLSFRVDYEPLKALGLSVFHSISSFNNAGFDLLGNFQSITNYSNDILLNITTAFLIIIGGLGFFVIYDIFSFKKNKRLRTHTKIVLTMSISLLIIGTFTFYFSERNITFLQAFFQSVTARTAGFNTINIGKLSNTGVVIMLFLMFVGASPGSTGGGIKTTTMFTIVLSIIRIPTHSNVKAFYRKISDSSIIKAFLVATLAMFAIIITGGIIFSIEGTAFSFEEVIFECVSAFATVGLSMGITTELSSLSKIFLIFLMFIGRIGPLTIAFSWRGSAKRFHYIEEEILIG
ncbi:MAG: potassium transporter TrkG [Sphaerochaetaceae bacterium]|nr:ATPase [Sphaerochaetaceae bacterium]MDC7238368.1 potassium transporter TrkG [Sphaerochaetaceae bacterium]